MNPWLGDITRGYRCCSIFCDTIQDPTSASHVLPKHTTRGDSWSGIIAIVSGRPTRRQIACTSDAILRPEVFGLEILELSATEHLNETTVSLFSKPPAPFTVSYCGVTVTYTHPGWNDTVNVLIWLPLENWNG
jgi:hypothetical protein